MYSKTPIIQLYLDKFNWRTNFLKTYYQRNDLIWQEGLLTDFLQKKVFDKWLRRFVIHSANILSEKFMFDKLIKVYGDLVIWPGTQNFIFEFSNIASLFIALLLPFILLFLTLFLNYIFVVFPLI
jgi:hypothetical protein